MLFLGSNYNRKAPRK